MEFLIGTVIGVYFLMLYALHQNSKDKPPTKNDICQEVLEEKAFEYCQNPIDNSNEELIYLRRKK